MDPRPRCCDPPPTSIQFYVDGRNDAGMMGYEYAIAAFNSFGESRYWTHSEDGDAP